MRRVRFGVCKSSFAKSYRSKNIFAELVARLQTLYYLFKVRRARVIKFKPRGFINRQRRKVGVGGRGSFLRSALALARSRARLALTFADVFQKNETENKKTSVYKYKERCCLVFPSSTKREIWHFHLVTAQRRQRNVQNVLHVQKNDDGNGDDNGCRRRCCHRFLSSLMIAA